MRRRHNHQNQSSTNESWRARFEYHDSPASESMCSPGRSCAGRLPFVPSATGGPLDRFNTISDMTFLVFMIRRRGVALRMEFVRKDH